VYQSIETGQLRLHPKKGQVAFSGEPFELDERDVFHEYLGVAID
jgi:hypothetical protein